MADPDRAAPHPLNEVLWRTPWRFDFFEALRRIECQHPDKPRLGTARKVGDDPVRLGQEVELDFPPSTLATARVGDGSRPARLGVRFLGLFGPQGPLPLHLTEYVRERLRHRGDRSFAAFADVFHHRMLCLFYRAWASARPTVGYDRPESDPFARYFGALFGCAAPALRNRDAMPDRAKLYFSGLLACGTKHADGLCALIGEFFGLPVAVREFVGEWMAIPPGEQTRLGASPRNSALGRSVLVGARVWGCQHKFRVVLGPMGFTSYRGLLPGEAGLRELVALVLNYAGLEWVFDVNLILCREEVPALRLDGTVQLGWTSWLGERTGKGDADDLVLDPLRADGWAPPMGCR